MLKTVANCYIEFIKKMADIKVRLIICMFVLLVCRDTKNFRSHIICYISSYMSNSTDGGGDPGVWPLCHNLKKKTFK